MNIRRLLLEPVMNFVRASSLKSINDIADLDVKNAARPRMSPQPFRRRDLQGRTGHYPRGLILGTVKIHNRL